MKKFKENNIPKSIPHTIKILGSIFFFFKSIELVYTPECFLLPHLFFQSFSILEECFAKSNLSAFKSMNEPVKKFLP